MSEIYDPGRVTLQRLADALGIPADRFFGNGSSTGTATCADECLRLWSMIRTEEGRRHALKALRAIADLEQP